MRVEGEGEAIRVRRTRMRMRMRKRETCVEEDEEIEARGAGRKRGGELGGAARGCCKTAERKQAAVWVGLRRRVRGGAARAAGAQRGSCV